MLLESPAGLSGLDQIKGLEMAEDMQDEFRGKAEEAAALHLASLLLSKQMKGNEGAREGK